MAKIKWRGREIKRAVSRAAVDAVNETMQDCVEEARRNHPGWKSRSGKLEGSIRIVDEAKRESRKVTGRWGAQWDWNANIVEKKTSFLDVAADKHYPKLAEKLGVKFRRRAL